MVMTACTCCATRRKALKARLRELEHLNEQLQKLASQSDVSVSHALKRLSEEELAAWVKEFDPTSFDFDYSEASGQPADRAAHHLKIGCPAHSHTTPLAPANTGP